MAVKEHDVSIAVPHGRELVGTLTLADDARGIVLFAHGSGSTRLSPRNLHVARALQARSLSTLLFDLLTSEEEQQESRTRQLRFDIELLTERLLAGTEFIRNDLRTRAYRIGYFGASTGAAAALVAAARLEDAIKAVVSRGGRPDLAAAELAHVRAPTLLIVGGADTEVLAKNRSALANLRCQKRIEIIPGAGHLFEEPGALDRVAVRASDWFAEHFTTRSSADSATHRYHH